MQFYIIIKGTKNRLYNCYIKLQETLRNIAISQLQSPRKIS